MQLYEQKNYYRAHVRDSDNMLEFKTAKFGEVHIIFGKIDDGSYQVQSLLFPKERFTLSTAIIRTHMLLNLF